MTNCRRKFIQENPDAPHPRSCAKCHLGPCKELPADPGLPEDAETKKLITPINLNGGMDAILESTREGVAMLMAAAVEKVTPFHRLPRADAELVYLLTEEANEVGKAAMKLMRHGPESCNPDKPEDGTNRAQLEDEIGDFLAAVHMLIFIGYLDEGQIMASKEVKLASVKKYLHHQEDRNA